MLDLAGEPRPQLRREGRGLHAGQLGTLCKKRKEDRLESFINFIYVKPTKPLRFNNTQIYYHSYTNSYLGVRSLLRCLYLTIDGTSKHFATVNMLV